MTQTKTKAFAALGKTTHIIHRYFIVKDDRVLLRIKDDTEAIEEMIDIIVAYFEDHEMKPQTLNFFAYRDFIRQELKYRQCYIFMDYALITTVQQQPKL